MIIRKVLQEDLNAVYDVEHDAFDGGYSYGIIRQYFDLFAESFYVAEDQENGVVGYVLVGPIFNSAQAWILTLAVKQAYQRNGIGTLLMETVHHDMREKGIRSFLLTTSPKKEHLIKFYGGLDYSIVGSDPNYFGEGAARVIMARKES